ncbi:MAG: peroxiredoxin-like family protein [Candidatus Competibacteraceae bacterium]|jgi:peroxiredoxin|nr:peroxiredoxin-like family protein [Candidatus Competibacteraceae bacterium]
MRKLVTPLAVVILLLAGALSAVAETLTEQLDALSASHKKETPADRQAIMDAAEQSLRESGLGNNAPRVGDQLPDGEFVTAKGETTSLYEAIGNRKAIVTFYRGGWCPYCNLQLHAYQEHLPEMEAAGATLVAITPETPDNSLSTSEKHGLKFSVLSDGNNNYARQINIVFALNEQLKPIYQAYGVDLEQNQANDAWELPLAATFIIDADRTVRYAFVDVDYKKRADPEELLRELQQLP